MTFSLSAAVAANKTLIWRRRAALMLTSMATLLFVMAGQSFVQAQDHKMMTGKKMMGDKMMAAKKKAYDGYCSVCVVEKQKWVKGSEKFATVYDGQQYLFPSENEKAMFLKNPAKYAPALGGDCIVCKVHANKMIPGSVKFAAFYKKRVFLFPSQKEKDVFLKKPEKYADADIAMGGLCAVCATHGKKIKGSTKHTVVYNKMRYLFPEAEVAKKFAMNPKAVLAKLKK